MNIVKNVKLYLSKALEQLKIVTLKLLGDSLVTAKS